uniref:energy transducer TonB n=1 Tax=Prevotella sp. TaxID=59823 RepID=UPI0040264232
MMDFLYYDLRVAVLIAVFYMFYRLLLSRDSFHQLNRVVLLGTALASFVLPLCVITIHHTEVLSSFPTVKTDVVGGGSAVVTPSTPWWHIVLPIVYWSGVIFTLLYTILSISKVCILIGRCEKHRQADGSVIAVADGEVSPFSWMHFIVVSRSDYAHPDSAILLHEREHIRRRHSWDVLLVDVLSSFQWFNPAIWMLRSDLRAIHEYEADAAVLSSGVDARQYQYLLVRKAMAAAGYSVVNGINHSTLKQRITMMNTHKQNRYSWLKAMYVLPIVAVSLCATAKTVTDYKVSDSVVPATAQPAVAQRPASTNASATTVEDIVEQKVAQKDSTKLKDLLVVVDGKEIPYSSLQNIDPSSISTISVYKDKAHTAQYGKKGANGVIVVTTKKAASAEGENKGAFTVIDEMPQFEGGSSAMMQFLSHNVHYPVVAQESRVEGRVVVSFIVKSDGSVADPTVVYNGTKCVAAETNTASGEKKEAVVDAAEKQKKEAEAKEALAQEALRVVSSMPAWTPGKRDGKPVNVKYNIPISFKLNSSSK